MVRLISSNTHPNLSQLKLDMKTTKGVSVTFDAWTDSAKLGWLGVTGHYLQGGLMMRSVLGVRPLPAHHTAEAIRDAVEAILAEVGLTNVVQAVTDNASVMIKACRLLGIPRSPCIAHLLQLVVASVFSSKSAANASADAELGAHTAAIETDDEIEEQEEEEEEALVIATARQALFFAEGCDILNAAGKIAAAIRNSTSATAAYLAAFNDGKVCF